jgi:hypothetical protein
MALATKRATVCPSCGQPVSAFAAGCAYCGADLESHRRKLRRRGPSLPRLGLRLDPHVVLVTFTVLLVLISPLLGLILAAVGAQDRHRSGQIGERNLFLALGAVDIALFFVPAVRFGVLSLIFG